MHNIHCIILTNLIPDRNKQSVHDTIIKEWLGLNNAVTVLELLTNNLEGKYLQPESAVQWLIDCVSGNIQTLKIVDASRDHYWRDVIEDTVREPMSVQHSPYPDSIFKDSTLPGKIEIK